MSPRRGLGGLVTDLCERLGRGVGSERGSPGDQGVEDRPQRIDVGGPGHRPAPPGCLFRGHVVRRPQDPTAPSRLAIGPEPPGPAEVDQMRLAGLLEHDIVRVKVQVQEPAPVCFMHRVRQRLHERRRSFPICESAELPVEARAADQLPDEVEILMGLAERIDRHDIRHGMRVVDPRGDPGLTQEPL